MRKSTLFLSLLVVSSFAFSLPDATEANVKLAAEKNLSVWLAKIPVGQEKSFGFLNRDEFISAQIGKPFHTITFIEDFYQDEILGNKNYLIFQNEWRVPVTVNNENRILLTANLQDNVYLINDMGGAGLSKELQQKLISSVDGSDFILRVYPMGIDIYVHTNQDQTLAQGTYIPLNSAVFAIKALNEKAAFTQAEILKIVKENLKKPSKN